MSKILALLIMLKLSPTKVSAFLIVLIGTMVFYMGSETIVTSFTFLFGVIALIFSVFACIMFDRSRSNLSRDANILAGGISFNLAGEALMTSVTLIFAGIEMLDYFIVLSAKQRSVLRLVMFGGAAITTSHIALILLDLGANKKDNTNG